MSIKMEKVGFKVKLKKRGAFNGENETKLG